MTSGLSSCASRTASSPVSASPITSTRSSRVFIKSISPWRNKLLSSAMNTRIVILYLYLDTHTNVSSIKQEPSNDFSNQNQQTGKIHWHHQVLRCDLRPVNLVYG